MTDGWTRIFFSIYYKIDVCDAYDGDDHEGVNILSSILFCPPNLRKVYSSSRLIEYNFIWLGWKISYSRYTTFISPRSVPIHNMHVRARNSVIDESFDEALENNFRILVARIIYIYTYIIFKLIYCSKIWNYYYEKNSTRRVLM